MIVTHDLERLARLYTGLIGATETSRDPARGRRPTSACHWATPSWASSLTDPSKSAPPGRELLSIEVADVDAALARVGSLGGRAPAPATDMPWGRRVAHVQDPDGNAVDLTATTG
jgi:predicted enzyme related to lactoylglutathione lyase